jgi:hypothetical protein
MEIREFSIDGEFKCVDGLSSYAGELSLHIHMLSYHARVANLLPLIDRLPLLDPVCRNGQARLLHLLLQRGGRGAFTEISKRSIHIVSAGAE